MNILRFSNCYLAGRVNPHYLTFLSCYKIDRKADTRLRTLCPIKYLHSDEKRTEECEQKIVYRKLHITSRYSTNVEEVTAQVLSFIKDVKMSDMKDAPQPVFWYSTLALLPFVAPPLSFLIFGYSSLLATMQLVFGATLCSYAGGMKWGYALHCSEHQPTWENLGWAIVPQMLGWLGLLVPHALGYLLVTAGVAISTYIDLASTNYPHWFRAIRLAVTIPAIIGLLLSLIIHVFH